VTTGQLTLQKQTAGKLFALLVGCRSGCFALDGGIATVQHLIHLKGP